MRLRPKSTNGFMTRNVTAAASLGISTRLEGPPETGVCLGESSELSWVQVGGHILVLSGPSSTRLPNGVTLSRPSRRLPHEGDRCVVGEGQIDTGAVRIKVIRWWDSRPSLSPVTPHVLEATAETAHTLLGCESYDALAPALGSSDPVTIQRAMRPLLGRGEGLTPEGDDVLVGVLAGLRLLGPALGASSAKALLDSIAPIILLDAPLHTTSLSASLLRHATAGEVAGPVASLLRALTGRGDLETAVTEVAAMGATSGTATACGVLLAAQSLAKGVNV
ncbi:MAG: DUF2877 domain-containing protein [Actinomycetota bacterium]|nr:DUF2877 domain-containing protein [Actinomycetota bacterium]